MIEGSVLADENDHVLDGCCGLLTLGLLAIVVGPGALRCTKSEKRKRDKGRDGRASPLRFGMGHGHDAYLQGFSVDGSGAAGKRNDIEPMLQISGGFVTDMTALRRRADRCLTRTGS